MAKDMESTKWLALATAKDDARPQLMNVYSNIATDGVRIHCDTSMPQLPSEDIPFPYLLIVEPVFKYDQHIDVSANHLISAMKALKVFKCYLAILTTNGDDLMIEGKTSEDDYPNVWINVKIPISSTTGIQIRAGFHPQFLLEAALGFTENDVISMYFRTDKPNKCPTYIRTALDVEARRYVVLMPLYLPEEGEDNA